jgi:hypothetical protein
VRKEARELREARFARVQPRAERLGLCDGGGTRHIAGATLRRKRHSLGSALSTLSAQPCQVAAQRVSVVAQQRELPVQFRNLRDPLRELTPQ